MFVALVNASNVVVNIADVPEGWTPPSGETAIPVTLGQAQAGWTYDGTAFAAPAVTVPLSQLVRTLQNAASSACAAITNQIVPDATHQNAYLNAAAILGPSATVPTAAPLSTAFAAQAAAWGQTPANFAAIVIAITACSLNLSAALATLEGDANTSPAPAQLAVALTAFEASLAALVAAINTQTTALGVTIIAPAAITIAGINA